MGCDLLASGVTVQLGRAIKLILHSIYAISALLELSGKFPIEVEARVGW